MSLFWSIYLSGYVIALLYLTDQFIDYCIKNRINYSEELANNKTFGMMLLYSLGSWLTLLFCYITREKD
jgi:hypothetical protein